MELINHCVFILQRGNRKAGPDGGNGGMGGNVILEADVSLKQLRHVRKYLKAEDGTGGQTKACHGRNGKDLIIKVKEDHTLDGLYDHTHFDNTIMLHDWQYSRKGKKSL